MSRRYLLSRPRTKMYDYNYTMGERYYRPTIESLDQRGARGSTQASSATTSSLADSGFSSAAAPARRRSLDESSDINDEMSATIRKIRASRAAMEEETRQLEETQVARRAANKARLDVSDRLMDSVGLKTNNNDEFTISRRPRRAISEIEDDSFFSKRTLGVESSTQGKSMARWSKLESRTSAAAEDSAYDEVAASNRAKQSRARIAEIEDEMEELANKAKARRERRAAAEAVLAEAADMDSSASSATVRVKRSVQVTEKSRAIM